MSKHIELDYSPWPHQHRLHQMMDEKDRGVTVWHRRAGKSLSHTMQMIKVATTLQRKSMDMAPPRILYMGPSIKQTKDLIWDYLVYYTRDLLFDKKSISRSELWVKLKPFGSRIRLYGANEPDSARGGYNDFAVVDEAQLIQPVVYKEIIEPTLRDYNGRCYFAGTPRGHDPLFYERMKHAMVDERYFLNIVRASESGVFTKEQLDATRADIGEVAYLQEYECNFDIAIENALIPIKLVAEAQKRKYKRDDYEHAPVIMGVDVAYEGDDSSVIQVRQGLKAFMPRELKNMRGPELALEVQRAKHEFNVDYIFIDAVGIGVSCCDQLDLLGVDIIRVNAGNTALDHAQYSNMRIEMWDKLKKWLEQGGQLPEHTQMEIDLTSPTYEFNRRNNKKLLESKKQMKTRGVKSPDFGDALAFTFSYPVGPKLTDDIDVFEEFERKRRKRRRRRATGLFTGY